MDPPRARIAFVAGSSGKEKHTRAKHMRISSQSLQLPTISGAMNTIIHENRPEQCFPSSWNGAGVTLRRASSAVPHFDDLSRQMQSTAVEIRNKPRRRTFGCCMYGEGRKQKTATHLSHSRTAQTQTVWPRPAYKGILTARVCYNIEGTMYAVPGCVSVRAIGGSPANPYTAPSCRCNTLPIRLDYQETHNARSSNLRVRHPAMPAESHLTRQGSCIHSPVSPGGTKNIMIEWTNPTTPMATHPASRLTTAHAWRRTLLRHKCGSSTKSPASISTHEA